MDIIIDINRLKNPRILKEWVIKNGSPDKIIIAQDLYKHNLIEIKSYIANCTKENIRFIKKTLGSLFIFKILPMLKYSSIEDFKLYKQVSDPLSLYNFKQSYEMLSKSASQGHLLAKKIMQRTTTIAIVASDSGSPFRYKVAVVEVPKLLWNKGSKCFPCTYIYKELFKAGIPKKHYIRQTEIRCKLKNSPNREYRISELVYSITTKNPNKIDYIEHIVRYLINLPDNKLKHLYEEYCLGLL